ncbi:MAG: hypothetical protein VKK62_05415 [Synechococcaceae cyanobacterium]|nr:hypothetical protein [Synechococcaceae cyanobacterium]
MVRTCGDVLQRLAPALLPVLLAMDGLPVGASPATRTPVPGRPAGSLAQVQPPRARLLPARQPPALQLPALGRRVVTARPAAETPQPLGEGRWYFDWQLIDIGPLSAFPEGPPALFADDVDISSYVRVEQGRYVIRASDALLRPGQQTLQLHQLGTGGEWRPLASYSVGRLDRLGLERSSFRPSVLGTVSSQPAFGRSGTALQPTNPETFVDFDYALGLETEMVRDGWTLSSRQQWAGTDAQPKALRFPVLGNKAPLFDLSGFNVSIKGPSTTIEIGDNSGLGVNPLLINRVANRGVVVNQRLGSLLQMGFTAQSGRLITGYDDLLGFNQFFNRTYAAEVSLTPFALPEHLSLSLSVADVEQPAQADFGFGQVAVDEASQGLGLSLNSALFSRRLQLALHHGSSNYSAPPSLQFDEFGAQSVLLKQTSSSAYRGSIDWEILKDVATVDANLRLRFEHYDPQYKTLSAVTGVDKQVFEAILDGRIGLLTYQVNASSFRDNLNNLVSLLTTKTDNLTASLTLPLATMTTGRSEGWKFLIPNISVSVNQLHQFGINPPLDDPRALFRDASQVPDQMNRIFTLGLTWDTRRLDFAYTYILTSQDNRQPLLALNDQRIDSHNLSFNWNALDNLQIAPRLSLVSNVSRATEITSSDLQYGLDINYQPSPGLSLSTGLASGSNYLSTGTSNSTSFNAYLQLALSMNDLFGLPLPAPASFFIRYNHSMAFQRDELAEFRSFGENNWLNAGFSLKLF